MGKKKGERFLWPLVTREGKVPERVLKALKLTLGVNRGRLGKLRGGDEGVGPLSKQTQNPGATFPRAPGKRVKGN